MLSPGTLHMAAGEEIKVPYKVLDKGKKGRKRSKKSASQGPPPTVLQDGPVEKSRRGVHVAGTPMICEPDRKSTRLNSSHSGESRMPSSA